MKTIFTISILLLLINHNSFAGQFRSVQSGNYDAVSTWTLFAGADADLKPDFNDTVIIRSGHTVGIAASSGGNAAAYSLDVQSGSVFNGNSRVFSVYTRLIQTGTMVGSLSLQFLDNCLFTASNYTAKGSIGVFYGKTLTIDVGSVISIQGYIEVISGTFGGPGKVINKGTVSLFSAGVIIGNLRLTAAGSKWINDGASSLTTTKACTSNATALIDFTSTGSSVTYASASTYVIPGNYYDLNITSSLTKTLSGDVLVDHNLTTNGISTNSIVLNGKTLTLNGNATLNGFFSSCVINGTAANSKILFNGTTNQTITGTGSFSVQTLEINNTSSSVTLSNSAQNSVHNTLLITAGSFNPNGKLTLVSDASNTARIAPITSGTITSNVVMQKYFPAFTARLFDLGSPSQGSVVMDWDDELYISGIGAYDGIGGQAGVDGDAVVPGSGLAAQSMFTYDEPTATYVAVTGSNTPLVPGTGYDLWFEDDVNGQWSAKTINTIGVPNQGDVSLTLGNSGDPTYGGYNLISNPYASAIDLSLIYDFSYTYYTNMNEFDVEVLDASGNFGYIDAISPGAIVYPHQGFWVQANAGGGNFTFFEGCKVSNVNTAFNRTQPANYDIKLMLSSTSSSYYHENTIHFNGKSTVNFERPYDIPYRLSPIKEVPALYMLDASNTKIAKNTINSEANDVSLPLGIFTPKTAVYYLDASVLNLDAYQYAWIENVKTGKQFDLNSSAIAIEGKEGQTNTDFVLRLSKTKKSGMTSQTLLESDLVIFNTEGTVNLKSTTSSHLLSEVTVYDMTGKLLISQSNVNVELGNVTKIDVSQLANGIYVVNVIDEKGNSISKKLIK